MVLLLVPWVSCSSGAGGEDSPAVHASALANPVHFGPIVELRSFRLRTAERRHLIHH
jgi:hypothetical protein